MDLRRACLATAALQRVNAELDPDHEAFHLEEAEKYEARANFQIAIEDEMERVARVTGRPRIPKPGA